MFPRFWDCILIPSHNFWVLHLSAGFCSALKVFSALGDCVSYWCLRMCPATQNPALVPSLLPPAAASCRLAFFFKTWEPLPLCLSLNPIALRQRSNSAAAWHSRPLLLCSPSASHFCAHWHSLEGAQRSSRLSCCCFCLLLMPVSIHARLSSTLCSWANGHFLCSLPVHCRLPWVPYLFQILQGSVLEAMSFTPCFWFLACYLEQKKNVYWWIIVDLRIFVLFTFRSIWSPICNLAVLGDHFLIWNHLCFVFIDFLLKTLCFDLFSLNQVLILSYINRIQVYRLTSRFSFNSFL